MSSPESHIYDTAVLETFLASLRGLSPHAIRKQAGRVRATHGDDLAWWQSTIDIDRRLHNARLSRRAAVAARAARDAVLAASGADPDDAEVAAVCRAAGDAARALVAGCHLTDTETFTVECEPTPPPSQPSVGRHPIAA